MSPSQSKFICCKAALFSCHVIGFYTFNEKMETIGLIYPSYGSATICYLILLSCLEHIYIGVIKLTLSLLSL